MVIGLIIKSLKSRPPVPPHLTASASSPVVRAATARGAHACACRRLGHHKPGRGIKHLYLLQKCGGGGA